MEQSLGYELLDIVGSGWMPFNRNHSRRLRCRASHTPNVTRQLVSVSSGLCSALLHHPVEWCLHLPRNTHAVAQYRSRDERINASPIVARVSRVEN